MDSFHAGQFCLTEQLQQQNVWAPCTFGSAEVHSVRHRAHALGVPCLDLEVVGGVQGQLLNLVGQPVAHHRLDHPVMDLCIHIGAVVDYVP